MFSRRRRQAGRNASCTADRADVRQRLSGWTKPCRNELRGAREAPRCGASLGEMGALYLRRHLLQPRPDDGCERRRERRAVVDVVGSRTGDPLVWPPLVVPGAERKAQLSEMGEPANQRHSAEPFVLESLDYPLCDGSRSVLPDRASSVFDVMFDEECGESRR